MRPAPRAPRPEIEPPVLFVTPPPAPSRTPSLPEIEPLLLTVLLLASDTPMPVLAVETTPAFEIVQLVPAAPSTPSTDPVEVTVPVLVMYKGLSAVPRITGPVVLLLMVLGIGLPQP